MKALVSSFSCSWGLWITLIAVVILSVTPDISLGATSQSAGVTDPPPEKVRQFLDLANNPEVKSWLEGKVAVQAPAAETSIADAISDWGAAVKGRVAAVVGAIDRVPDEIANSSAVFVRDVNAGRPGLVLIIFVALLAVGFGAERLILSVLAKRNTDWSRVDPVQATMSHAVALVTFSLATITLYLLFDWPPLLGKTILLLLVAFILFRLIHGIARLLLAFDGVEPENQSSVSQVDTVARFWLRRIDLVAGLTLAGWVVVNVMSSSGFSAEVTKLAAFVLGLGILGIGIEVVWRRPRVTTSVIVRSLLSAYMVLLWLAWVGGLLGLLFVGIYSLVLPGVIRSVGNLAQALASRAQLSGAFGVLLNVVIVRGARALVIAAAVAWLAYAWRFSAAALAGSEIGKVAVNGISNAIVILLVADLFWQSSKALIAYRMELAEHSSDSDHLARSDRLRTLLPIFRNTLAVLIGAIAILTILSGLGVQIAPLLAGAGIFGVAIGFGSQTLVKDVLSGVFYMLDDAFRVGEYIQSGSYKGTVESFSLRSVRLRHHRGPIFTVPFGELGAVENMSRDWVIDKMTINVTYDSDIELARKLIKKIGQELAADPEFAADTLQPLKMQGVDSFGDFAIVLRLKLMTKPNAQFAIKRRAFMMIKKVFDENGIKIAVPTVHVEGSGESAAAAAHQVQQSAKAAQVAEAAGQAVA
ncbi:mechanosensitive ion channel family protein [Ensifer adhaerens]|uniref:mechanosensitive ion channel family protein n=1 Tax=Ensifer adhaerens TaxID=106592 RepID=UPI001C4E09FF|nr:mechanosensitive ion channel family protein [Ensifer adhaerens]MBW0368097.1 mechanosensitive ion channel family protein [Ensifer adhaerens]UCM23655.1 mechanosensitive ion channel family protein [Ensifer adhaerens]